MNVINKRIIAVIAAMISILSNAQSDFKNKLALQIYKSTNDSDQKKLSNGVEIEYQRKINRWFAVGSNIEKSRFDNIPDINPYKNSEGTGNIKDFVRKEIFVFSNETINYNAFSLHILFTPINNQNNIAYISNGLGYALQDITYQNVIKEDYIFTNKTLQAYNVSYMTKNTKALTYLLGIGYDRYITNNWFLGINIRGQLPLIRDKYFWKTGGGFDELLRYGVKIGRRF